MFICLYLLEYFENCVVIKDAQIKNYKFLVIIYRYNIKINIYLFICPLYTQKSNTNK